MGLFSRAAPAAQEADDAERPGGWDGLSSGAKLGVAVLVVGGLTAAVVFSGGGKPPPKAVPNAPQPTASERVNDYDPPPAGGVLQDAVANVGNAFRDIGGTRAPRRRPPTEMALYSAPNDGAYRAASVPRETSVGPSADRDDPVGGDAALVGARGDREDRLASHLAQPVALPTNRARLALNRDFMIDAGADIPCLPVDAQNSAQPGFTKCRVPEWFRSSNMRRGLLPPGTIITGQIREGVDRGQRRLGLLYTRIDAGHFKVKIAAPGADAMGRAGLDAHEETFFWDRAGAAALFSLFDIAIGAGQAAGTAALSGAISGGRGGTVLNLGGVGGQAQGLAAQEMQSRLNRPAELSRRQALPVTVTVGQDLDFTDACRRAMAVNPMACPLM